MRLTEKINGKYCYKNQAFIHTNMTKKLGQLEDIEEELGIDLVTLFEAFKNGIYCFNENKEIFFEKIEHFVPCMEKQLHTRGKLSIIHGVKSEGKEKHFAIKDYGKTWALTVEELL